MASYGDDATLMKVAVFGLAMSIICTMGIQIMFVETGDYSYDDIQAYRNELINFSGESMVNNNPWVLVHAYTPWDPSSGEVHYDDGWLYGEDLGANQPENAPFHYQIGDVADLHMNPAMKSSAPITFNREVATVAERSGDQWWANIPIIGWIGKTLGFDPYTYQDIALNNWSFTGVRYVLDPVLPFAQTPDTPSAVDGSLSLVWYSYNGQEGISGGLDIYGGKSGASTDVVKLASYSATDIIADYNDSSSYATVYDFDFEGTHLNLSIRFDPEAIEDGIPLMQAWTDGMWSFAISSVSAGNFLDIDNSTSYTDTMGSMLDTFIKIYTFNLPNFNNEWAAMILWLMVGLPMTIALLCVTMRLMNAIKIL